MKALKKIALSLPMRYNDFLLKNVDKQLADLVP